MLSPVANYLILPVVNIVNGLIYHINFNIPKALLLGAIFHATPLRDKLHVQCSKSLQNKLHQSLHKVE